MICQYLEHISGLNTIVHTLIIIDMKLFRGAKQTTVSNLAKTAIVKTAGRVKPVNKSPDEAYGELFSSVQKSQVYGDGKTFVDLVPRRRTPELLKAYKKAAQRPDFNLQSFIDEHFYEFAPHKDRSSYKPDGSLSTRQHITRLWPELERRNRRDRGSLVALPHPYLVPGGRFSEQFYWDTYFIMLGLAADKDWQMLEGMMKNYAYLIRKFGYIPTANRTYFLSRSQPPFFVHMVKLLAGHKGRLSTYSEYLPYLIQEYRFWMRGRAAVRPVAEKLARYRVVALPDGTVVNRYFDNKATPRPESQREDLETATRAQRDYKEKLYVDLRAGAESGWDFSSRWFDGGRAIENTATTDIVPVDLNSLLYTLEQTIGETYSLIKQPVLAKRFLQAAERRAVAVRNYCWDNQQGFFVDYNFRTGRRMQALTLAGVFPLYAKIATKEQADLVAKRIEEQFFQKGGLLTTLQESGEQWDAPNGWAPLQWVAIKGLREYGYYGLADKIRDAWLKTNELVYKKEHKMIEKYNVVEPGKLGGGGEYGLQDGFGWTNGVYAALKDEQQLNQHPQKERR